MQQIGLICVFRGLKQLPVHLPCAFVAYDLLRPGGHSWAAYLMARQVGCLSGVLVIGRLGIRLLETREMLIEIKCLRNLLN